MLRQMPGFIITILEKIVHQDDLNKMLSKFSSNVGISFLPKILEEMNIKVEVEGLDNLPECGKCFFVANHPYGIADGLVLTSIVSGKYGEFKAIGNDVFILIPQLKPLIAAVNVFGKNNREYIMELDKVYNSEIPITHFPAGLVSRIKRFRVMDSEWQKSFISKSIECKRDIVPLYFHGRNSTLFYTVFLLRKSLGIKATLELALLPHEFFNKRNKTIKVTIGKPIRHDSFNKEFSALKNAQIVKSRVYELAKD